MSSIKYPEKKFLLNYDLLNHDILKTGRVSRRYV